MLKHILCICLLGLPAAARAQQAVPLDSIKVEVSSRVTPGAALRAVDVITRADIERLPFHTLAGVIGRTLGADVLARSPAQADLSLRGSTTEQVLVLIDGVPFNDAQTGHFHLDQAVPLADVERIEVLRGAASSLHGANAVGGIVNIVTRAGSATTQTAQTAQTAQARQTAQTPRRAGAVAVRGGSFGAAELRANASTRFAATDMSAAAEHARSDGHRAGTDYRNTVMRVALAAPVLYGALRASAGIADRAFGAAQFYGPFPASHEATRAVHGDVSWTRIARGISFEPRVSVRTHDDDFVLRREDPSFYRNIHATTDVAAAFIMRTAGRSRFAAAAGADAQRSSIESTNLGDHDETRTALFGEIAFAGDRATQSADNPARRAAPTPAVTVGLRADHSSTYGTFVSPSIAAGLTVSSTMRLRASAARGFRAPTWTDRYYSDPANRGDSTLAVERAWSYDIGLHLAPYEQITIEAGVFQRDMRNAIDWVRPRSAPSSTPWQIVNVQDVRFRGAELSLGHPALLGAAWTARASALSFDAEEAAASVSKYALRPLQESASLEVWAPLPAGIDAGLSATHARRAGEEDWQMLDAQVRWTRGPWQMSVGGTNLGAQHYTDVAGMPSPGRAFFAGLRWGGALH